MDQRIVSLRRFHDHVAATAAVATRRTAAGYKLLPAEGHTTVAAIAGFDPYLRFIDKHSLIHTPQPTAVQNPKRPSSQSTNSKVACFQCRFSFQYEIETQKFPKLLRISPIFSRRLIGAFASDFPPRIDRLDAARTIPETHMRSHPS